MSVDILGTNCDQCVSESRSCVKVEVFVLGCPSWAVRPGLSVLTSLLVSVDVKIY